MDKHLATELIYQLSRVADALEKLELTTYEPSGEVEDLENGDGEEIEANEFEEVSQG